MKRIKISSDDAKAVSASASAGAEESSELSLDALDEGAKESDDEEDDDDNGSVEEGSDEDKKPPAKGSTVADEDNDNDSDDESLSQTGKPSAKAKLAAHRRLKELENLEQAEIFLAVHREKIEKQVLKSLKNKGIALTRDARGNMKGHNVYPWNG
jgi:hypothetical protein